MDRKTLLVSGAAAFAAAARPAGAQTKAMTALIAAAKTDGSVVVDGPGVDAVRMAITQGFQRAYGIPVSYISSGTSASAARVRAERASGKYLLDVLISGPDTPTVTFLPSGWLERVEPALIDPDVTDARKWKDGHLWYEDPGKTILRFQQYVFPELAVNTKLVKPSEVSTWKSLLDPKWQGKMVAKDPATSGSGGSLTSYFYMEFGPDFVKKLYVGQKPQLSRDARQAMQWLAEGTYPILVGPDMPSLVQFQKLGYPIAPVFPADGPVVLSGGYGLLGLVNKAPHPNAAKLFCNWLASRSAQEAFSAATHTLSLRTDVTYDSSVASFQHLRKGQTYLDTYDFTFVTQTRDPANEKVRALLGE